VRITVSKRAEYPDLIDEYVPKTPEQAGYGACGLFRDGQTVIVGERPDKPADFQCHGAWADIRRDVAIVLFGGDAPWINRPGTMITSCTDGLRPVTFLIERIEE
jgi:uncharacterized repeat protein (TIGR04076 family)